MDKDDFKKGEIVIYKTSKNEVGINVRLKEESVWLSQAQIALLFDTERSVITKHIHSIFTTKELNEKSNVQKMHIPNSDKPVKFSNAVSNPKEKDKLIKIITNLLAIWVLLCN